MRRAIWYHLHKLKNLKNTHAGVLLSVRLQPSGYSFTKVALLHGCLLQTCFLSCTNGFKSRKASHIQNEVSLVC